MLGAGEHEHAVVVRFLQQRAQQLKLLCGSHWVKRMRHGLRRGSPSADLDDFWIRPQRPLRQFLYFGRQRGRKEQGLPLLARRAFLHQSPHVRQETHVQHAIHLVEHEDFYTRQRDLPLLEVIEQPPGRGDDDIQPALEFLALLAVPDAAVERRRAQVREFRVIAERLVHLHGQLARRLQDQHAGRTAPMLAQPREDRQRERRRLACTRLRRADEVFARERDGDALLLDRGRFGVTGRLCPAGDRIP